MTTKKSKKKLEKGVSLYSNIPKPGSRVIFKEKMGSRLNKETVAFASGYRVPMTATSKVVTKNSSMKVPSVKYESLGLPDFFSNFFATQSFLVQRIGQNGKFRFSHEHIKVPLFNGPVLNIFRKEFKSNANNVDIITKDCPLLMNIHDNKSRPLNNPFVFDPVKELSSIDFMFWAAANIIFIHNVYGDWNSKNWNNPGTFFENKYTKPIVKVGSNTPWDLTMEIAHHVLRNREIDRDSIENNASYIFDGLNNRRFFIYKLKAEVSKAARMRIFYLENLITWSHLINQHIKDIGSRKQAASQLKEDENKELKRYLNSETQANLNLFLSKAIMALRTNKQSEERQRMIAKIYNRFM